MGGMLTPSNFIKDSASPGKELFRKLKYHLIIDYYFSKFGKRNVYPFLYEDLLNNQEECLNSMAEFIGFHVKPWNDDLKLNKSNSKSAVEIMRLSNRICKAIPWLNGKSRNIQRYIIGYDKFDKRKSYFKEPTKTFIKNSFAETNINLLPLFQEKLYHYDYV